MNMGSKETKLIIRVVLAIITVILAYMSLTKMGISINCNYLLVGYIFYNVLELFYYNCIKQEIDLKKYGKWAIITGATSGLGQSYAELLAKRGLNLLIISRSRDKLLETANKFTECQVEIMEHDYSDMKCDEFYQKLMLWIEEKEKLNERIGILINNVGVANENPTYFNDMLNSDIQNMININIYAMINMTKAVIPYFISNKNGLIVNVSSASGNHPSPFLSVYSATKAFITQYSESLSFEYKSIGIDVYCLTPYYFISNMFARKRDSFLVPKSDLVARASLREIGSKIRGFPYIIHELIGIFLMKYMNTGNFIRNMMIKSIKRKSN